MLLNRPFSAADKWEFVLYWLRPGTSCPLKVFKLLRTALELCLADRTYQRGDHARHMTLAGIGWFAYRGHWSYLMQDQDLETLYCGLRRFKTGDGTKNVLVSYPRRAP